jgi:anti-sigma factor RsiW
MTFEPCDEQRLVAFLAGDLDPVAASSVDAHLLACDGCWAAVGEDQRGQAAAETLREPAPGELHASILSALRSADPQGPRPRRFRAVALVSAAAAIVAAGLAATMLLRSQRPVDPGAVAAVVRLAGDTRAAAPAAGPLRVWRTTSPSGSVVVAESSATFPMPPGARTARLGTADVWLARRGDVRLLCVMSPRHALLAGAVPTGELASVARAYGLLS